MSYYKNRMEAKNETTTKSSENILVAWFNRNASSFEERRFAAMCVMITIQSCLGSIACMYILQSEGSMSMLMSGAAITMGSNSAFIAQAPPKWCLSIFYISIVVNSLLILVNL